MELKDIIENVKNIVLIKGEEVFSIYNRKDSTMIMLYNQNEYDFVIEELMKKDVEVISREIYLNKYHK